MNHRNYSPLDTLLINVDQAVRTLFGQPQVTERANPAQDVPETELSQAESREVAGLMRINHAGEVCAQALYQGQALTARLPEVRASMDRAAQEENDHLDWCEGRVKELGSHTSYLNPFWYAGSFAIGALAGAAGDKWSLGFVAETERQVVRHLDNHLGKLPVADEKSRAILEQMREDELRHATIALEAGGAELPEVVKRFMGLSSQVMTKTVYWI
jgi:ubiquinone biosynthesis monooxygenase Coq7